MINDKPMTKRRFEQYTILKREIAMLEDQIAVANVSGELVWDIVQKDLRPFIIKGYGSQAIPKLSARKASCIQECAAVEKYIESVDDSVMRQLLTRRYIEGRTLEDSALLVGYSRVQAWRLMSGFFEKMKHCVT